MSLKKISLLVAVCAVCTDALAAAPYPPSSEIISLTWAPEATIVRLGPGSDNWPVTWADDDDLYTAYGDGKGFVPQVPSKLSLGLGKVMGPGDAFTGVNIVSPTGQQTGGGPSGKKASGMLMVDGVLYMWVRNANNDGAWCQLAWSTDHAATWTWSTWNFEELGYCTFLNFGKNYAGARDDFVYMYSHDDPSAYTPADHMVLTRVPKDQITDRAAYEFFVGLDVNDDPIWSTDIAQRGPVFTNTGLCARNGISYNAALGRYLWWQQLPVGGIDTRFGGGFGIYEAPEPWGPWSTVYFTESWDVGPGESARFPTKWMSPDGLTLYLVFSGNDRFSVRRADLTLGCTPGPPDSCDDLDFCNGVETCDPVLGCQPGTPPVVDDGVACTVDSCDEVGDVIVNTPDDGLCDDAAFCNGSETCDALTGCQPGTPPVLDDGVACTDDSCDEGGDVIVHTPNHAACDDLLFCTGTETCDAVAGCQPGTPPPVDDGIACTHDFCWEEEDEIVNAPSSFLCDDQDPCTADLCDELLGCDHVPIPACRPGGDPPPSAVPAMGPGGRALLVLLVVGAAASRRLVGA